MIYSSHQQEFSIIILQIEANFIHHINRNLLKQAGQTSKNILHAKLRNNKTDYNTSQQHSTN